ncbi:MAG: hypothetical protein LBP67_05185 [Bacteroidales bacterium]|jgi:hypothetical protein|nr:hypothetical protein [Bacteroidales bacterium]
METTKENKTENKPVIGYKGFDKELKCRDKQYEIGKEETEGEVKLCEKGFHFCENPHDVLGYYSAGDGNRFAIVEANDVSGEKGDNNSKRVAKRILVKSEIGVFNICKIAVSAFFENFDFKKKINSADTNNAGNYGAANAGNGGAANAGDCGAANAGYYGAANAGNGGAANAGNYSAANAGDRGAANAGNGGAANAGYGGAANAGDRGAANAGNRGAANAGDRGAANAGDGGAASVKENGVAIASTDGKVKGGKGSVIILTKRDINYNIIDFAAAQVDGINIEADVWYRLDNGKLIKAE